MSEKSIPWNMRGCDYETFEEIPEEKWSAVFGERLQWWEIRDIRDKVEELLKSWGDAIVEIDKAIDQLSTMYTGKKYEYALEYLRGKGKE